MNAKTFFALVALAWTTTGWAQPLAVGKQFTLQAQPVSTELFLYTGAGSVQQVLAEARSADIRLLPAFKALGDGAKTLQANTDAQLVVVALHPGFVPEVRAFVYDKTLKKKIQAHTVEMSTRIFKIDVEPYDAELHIDGKRMPKPYPIVVELPKNSVKTAEVKRVGFLTVRESFFNQADKPEPPKDYKRLSLTNRVVQLETTPKEGARIFVDGVEVGEGNSEIVVPQNSCVLVKVRREGFIEKERSYCYKEGMPEPPLADAITLLDREVVVRGPEGCAIKVNGKQVGTGEYKLKLLRGSSAKISVEKAGYVTYQTTVFNTETDVAPPPFISLQENSAEMPIDESFKSSVETDLANRDFGLEVPATMNEQDAWRLISSVIYSKFDVVELADAQTGYLRTAWVYKRYASRTVRTRVIVKIKNRNPLSYSLKIQSEECSDLANLGSKDDDNYNTWNRVLNVYSDIIAEVQARLR